MSSPSVPRKAPQPDPPLPSAGSPGVGSPTSPVLSADSDPSPPVPPRFVAFARRYHRLPRSLPGAGALLRGLGHFYRGARAACLRWRRGGIPSSWATLACMPCSSTPADRSHPATPMRAMLPSAYITTSAPRLGFRGSITRPTGSLCTLRSRGRPRTTQHSVPAGGQPWPVRSCTCWVAKKVSALLVSLHSFLLHQALLGAIYNPHYFLLTLLSRSFRIAT